jgi:hypothetical protein
MSNLTHRLRHISMLSHFDVMRTAEDAAARIEVLETALNPESVLSAILRASKCGIGDIGPDGKHRSIACNDKSLEGDRNYYFEDCDCSRIADAVMSLASSTLDKDTGK